VKEKSRLQRDARLLVEVINNYSKATGLSDIESLLTIASFFKYTERVCKILLSALRKAAK
jgi:hypothetical protein